MNGVIDFDGENINATSITAESITTDDLEIKNNLLVATKNISPVELSFLDNVTSNIQNQLQNKVDLTNVNQSINGTKTFLNSVVVNGITTGSTTITNFEIDQLDAVTSNIQQQLNNKVDLTNTQSIGGNKTFNNQVTLSDDLIVNSKNISPAELATLDGINTNQTIQQQLNKTTYTTDQTFTENIILNGDLIVNTKTISPAELATLDGINTNQTIQQQLDNAGISNAMTLNTNQTATGQKLFTQPVGLPSVVYSNETGSFYGIKLDDDTVTSLAQTVTGVWTTGTSVVNGIDAFSVLTSVVQTGGGNYVGFNLTDSQSKQPSFKSTYGYVNDSQTGIILLDATNLVANNNPTIPLSPIPSGLIFPRWDGSTYINQADFLKTITNTEITLSNKLLQNGGIDYYDFVKQKSTFSGYLKTSNQIVRNPVYTINVNDFVEQSFLGLSVPSSISSINGNILNLTSTNTAQTAFSSVDGYFSTANTFYHYQGAISGITGAFVSGNNQDGSIVSSKSDITISVNNNTYVSPIAYTRTGYAENNTTIVLLNTSNIVLNQAIESVTLNIFKGNNYVINITNNEITLGNNAITGAPLPIPNVPPRPTFDGYLFSNSELITNGVFLVNDFVANQNIGSKICQAQGQTGQVVILNETSTNTPTPNNKTYNGFSQDATTFYFRDNTTNVDIDYYLKDNSIPIPTVNHLITNFDTVNKTLTTSNLPNTTVSNTYYGYANSSLNQIITTSTHNVSVNDGIFSNLNSGIRFVSAISPEYYEGISVYGSLNFEPRIRDTQGICIGGNLCMVYDPNGRLLLNDFLVDYDSGGLIPPDCVIATITSVGFDFYSVDVLSLGTFTENTQTRYSQAFRPSSNSIVVNDTGLNDKIYQIVSNSGYRFITGQTADLRVYTTNDTGSDFNNNNANIVNIITQLNTRFMLLTDQYINSATPYLNKYVDQSTLIPASCFVKTDSLVFSTTHLNGSVKLTIQNTANYLDFNYGNYTNPYIQGGVSGLSLDQFGGDSYFYNTGINNIVILVCQQDGLSTPYTPVTNDIILDMKGTDTNTSLKARESSFSGLRLNQSKGGNQTGNCPIPATNPNLIVSTYGSNRNRYLYAFYPPTPTQTLIFTTTSSSNSYIFLGELNFRMQLARIKNVQTVNFGGNIYYQYNLDRDVTPVSPNVPWVNLEQVYDIYQSYGSSYTFRSVKMRPSLLTSGYNYYNTTLQIDIPNNQSEYEVVDAQQISIYKTLDSYNSYEKSTFQQISPINDLNIFNSETIDFFTPITFSLFKGLTIDFYNTSSYTLNSEVDLTFPLLPNNTEFLMQDAVQDVYNKTLQAPTLRTYNGNFPTFPDGTVQMTGTTNNIFYDNQLRIFNNQGSVQNVTFSQNETRFFTNVLFDYPFKSPNQPQWYTTSSGNGNQWYNAGARIGSAGYTGGVALSYYFDYRASYNTVYTTAWDPAGGAFYANEGIGIYLVELYIFCNNANAFAGRISLQTNSGRSQAGNYNFNVNRSTSIENCANLTWVWYPTGVNEYIFFYIHSSSLLCYIGSGHTALRITKVA
jgi:hypothetical protein